MLNLLITPAYPTGPKATGLIQHLLEIDQKQPEAIGLYKSAGYYQNYGQNAHQLLSVCFEKKIQNL